MAVSPPTRTDHFRVQRSQLKRPLPQAMPRASGSGTPQATIHQSGFRVNPAVLNVQDQVAAVKNLGKVVLSSASIASATGENIGTVRLKLRTNPKEVEEAQLILIKEEASDHEVIKLERNGQLLGFMDYCPYYKQQDKSYAGLSENELFDNASIRYCFNEKDANQVFTDYASVCDEGKYTNTLKVIEKAFKRRVLELEKEKNIKFSGLHFVASWNSAYFVMKRSFRPMDTRGFATAAEMDAFTEKQIAAGGDTSALGCNLVYLPKSSREKIQAELDKGAALLDAKGTLAKGTKVLITNNHDQATQELKLEAQEILGDGKSYVRSYHLKDDEGTVLASITINKMPVNKAGNVYDYIGEYPEHSAHYEGPSPFAIYGAHGEREVNVSRIYMELDTYADHLEQTNAKEILRRLIVEVAIKDKDCKGRVQAEADWGEDIGMHKFGFRHQEPPQIRDAAQIQAAYEKIWAATPRGQIPNLKQLGSVHVARLITDDDRLTI